MKITAIIILFIVAILGGSFLLGQNISTPSTPSKTAGQNVTTDSGKQIIEIHAKGGYNPRKSVAKAGVPTILRFITDGTFDCSSSIRIPSLDITKTLPLSGTTDIAIDTPKNGALKGSCGMGMYPFEIQFNG